MLEILIRTEDEELLPRYGSTLAAGADIKANVLEPIVIPPHKSALVPTGLFCEIPPGYEIQIRPRSGLAAKFQVTVLNTPGTIDADYRGEIKVILINHGEKEFIVNNKDRIAQIVVAKVETAEFIRVDALVTTTARGEGGFGHTGHR